MEASMKEMETDVLEFDAEWDDFLIEMQSTHVSGTRDVDSIIDWHLEKLRANQAEVIRNRLVANQRVETIRDWEAGEFAKLDRQREYIVGQIGQLAPPTSEATVEEYGKKSRTLPNGSFGFRAKPDRIEIEDAEKALAYAKQEDLEITVRESVSKTVLKKWAQGMGVADGGGWRLEPGKPGFFVTPAK